MLCVDLNPSSPRFSRDRPRFIDTLDMIKFLCKDMWTLLFRKQIDNLKTNHRVSLLKRHSKIHSFNRSHREYSS